MHDWGNHKGGGHMVKGYDSWLLRQADAYWESCEPELDRNGEYTKCINCFEQCDAYKEIIGEKD